MSRVETPSPACSGKEFRPYPDSLPPWTQPEEKESEKRVSLFSYFFTRSWDGFK